MLYLFSFVDSGIFYFLLLYGSENVVGMKSKANLRVNKYLKNACDSNMYVEIKTKSLVTVHYQERNNE